MVKIKDKYLNFSLFLFVFFGAFFVYLKTLAPTVTCEDSGELITAAYLLGVPHQPGFPLWCLLAKVFTFLPFGNIAYRVNLMSAFWGALSAGLLTLLLFKLTKNKGASLAGGLLLAFSYRFWGQSVIAEVYTLNIFFVLACLGALFL